MTIAVSVDHIFIISIALLGGFFWFHYGYWVVFAFGALIALINIFVARGVKT